MAISDSISEDLFAKDRAFRARVINVLPIALDLRLPVCRFSARDLLRHVIRQFRLIPENHAHETVKRSIGEVEEGGSLQAVFVMLGVLAGLLRQIHSAFAANVPSTGDHIPHYCPFVLHLVEKRMRIVRLGFVFDSHGWTITQAKALWFSMGKK